MRVGSQDNGVVNVSICLELTEIHCTLCYRVEDHTPRHFVHFESLRNTQKDDISFVLHISKEGGVVNYRAGVVHPLLQTTRHFRTFSVGYFCSVLFHL